MAYSDIDKERLFWDWYNNGKLPLRKFKGFLVNRDEEVIPGDAVLGKWFKEWRPRADGLDQEVRDKFSAEVIETKVEMLRRHADLGKHLQAIGLEWLQENTTELTPAAVARIIKDGYEMERASVGVPEALTKMLSVSDDELKKQIEAALTDEALDL